MFEITDAEVEKAKAQVRGLRRRETWLGLAGEERFWSPAFLMAAADEIDKLLLEDPETAYIIGDELPQLAERLRPSDCPLGERGKRSLVAWLYAVKGSTCRVMEHFAEAEEAFGKAEQLALDILPWAKAEILRRHAALMAQRLDAAAFGMLDAAHSLYKGWPRGQAETLVLKGIASRVITGDLEAAVTNYSAALQTLGPPKSGAEKRVWAAGVQNCANALSRNAQAPTTVLVQALVEIEQARRKLSKNAAKQRMLLTWIRGLLLERLGQTKMADASLTAAWDWFREQDLPQTLILVAIDLVSFLENRREKSRAQQIINDTSTALEKLKPQAYGADYLATWIAAESERRGAIRYHLISSAVSLRRVSQAR